MKIFLPVILLIVIIPALSFSQNEINQDPVFTVVETEPVYPGGQEALMSFIKDNLVYPKEAKEKGVEGTVFASFIIEKDGSVSSLKIIKSVGSGCDEEVLRVLNLMKKWKPGQQNGKKVRVQFNLPVKFSMT
jgi:periplasmic protein TonB